MVGICLQIFLVDNFSSIYLEHISFDFWVKAFLVFLIEVRLDFLGRTCPVKVSVQRFFGDVSSIVFVAEIYLQFSVGADFVSKVVLVEFFHQGFLLVNICFKDSFGRRVSFFLGECLFQVLFVNVALQSFLAEMSFDFLVDISLQVLL